VPGILAGVAAVITALGGLLALYIRSHPANSLDPDAAPPREAIFLSDQAPSDIPSEPHGGLGRDKAYGTDRIVLNGRQLRRL
jgi:hypothetical protein